MSNNEKSTFLAVLAYGQLSTIELANIRSAKILEFEIIQTNDTCALIECSSKTAHNLAKRLGGTYKIAANCGTGIDDLFDNIVLPESPKFNWTVSGYQCDSEQLKDLHPLVQSFLKSKSLGKSRYLEPTMEKRDMTTGDGTVLLRELSIRELDEKVLAPRNGTLGGFEVVVCGSFGESPLFGYTIETSDVAGFDQRDFSRSYQDPTTTLSPRLARVMVNLAVNSRAGTLLDPFCGLGTILQEALICGYDVVGVDISEANIRKARTNLGWLYNKYHLSPKLRRTLIRGDSTRVHERLNSIQAIATEPILVPTFEKNPSPQVASRTIHSVKQTYDKAFRALDALATNSKIAITNPVLIDDGGHRHTFDLQNVGENAGFEVFKPDISGSIIKLPLRVPTTKKKIVQRDVYVMVKK